MLGGLEDLPDNHLRNIRPALVHLLDLHTREGKEIDQFLGGVRQGYELAKPGK
jgi:hypothetical protein